MKLLALLIFAAAMTTNAATYYVNSSTGNDANVGSSGSPWRTLHLSIPKLVAGDTLNCTGTFDEPNGGVSWQYSVAGTFGNPIIIQGFGAGATIVMEASSSVWFGIHRFTGQYIQLQNLGITSAGNSNGGVVNGGVAVSFEGANCSILNCEVSNVTAQVVSSGDTCEVFGDYTDHTTYSNLFIHGTKDSDLWRMFGSYNLITHCIISNCNNANYSAGGNHADLIQNWARSLTDSALSNVFECNLYVSNGIPGTGVGPTLGISGGIYQCFLSGNQFSQQSPNMHDWIFRNNVFDVANQELEVETPGMHFYNNVFYNWHGGLGCMYLYSQQVASGAHFYNNVFINSPISDLNGGSSKTMDYNAIDSTSSSQSQNLSAGTYGPNNFAITTGSAGFVNPGGADFHLTGSSALIGRGINLYNDPAMSRTDRDGVARPAVGAWDIGPYQFVSSGSPITTSVVQVLPASVFISSPLAVGSSASATFTAANLSGPSMSGTSFVAAPFAIGVGSPFTVPSNGTPATVSVSFVPTQPGYISNYVWTLSNAGSNYVNGIYTQGGNVTNGISGISYAIQPNLAFPSYAGTISGDWTTNSSYIYNTTDYSSGGLSSIPPTSGIAVYGFIVTNAGNYLVSANVIATNEAQNSVWVNIDLPPVDPVSIWDIPLTGGATNRTVSWRGNGTSTNSQFVPQVWSLTAGTHYLTIKPRETTTLIGQISIFPQSAVVTNNLTIAVNPSSISFGVTPTNAPVTNTIMITASGTVGTLTGTATVSAPFSILSGGSYSLTAGQSQTLTVKYSPTTPAHDSKAITFTGGGGATANVDGYAFALCPLNALSMNAAYLSSGFILSSGAIYSTNGTFNAPIPPPTVPNESSGLALVGFSLTNQWTNVVFNALMESTNPSCYAWFTVDNVSPQNQLGIDTSDFWIPPNAPAGLSNQRINYGSSTNTQFSLGPGNHFVAVWAGSPLTLISTLSVQQFNSYPISPLISTQPQSQTLKTGDTLLLSTLAIGTLPLSYQWRFNGTAIANATSSSLTNPYVQLPNAGIYDCLVSNVAGSADTFNAQVIVLPPPNANAPSNTVVQIQ